MCIPPGPAGSLGSLGSKCFSGPLSRAAWSAFQSWLRQKSGLQSQRFTLLSSGENRGLQQEGGLLRKHGPKRQGWHQTRVPMAGVRSPAPRRWRSPGEGLSAARCLPGLLPSPMNMLRPQHPDVRLPACPHPALHQIFSGADWKVRSLHFHRVLRKLMSLRDSNDCLTNGRASDAMTRHGGAGGSTYQLNVMHYKFVPFVFPFHFCSTKKSREL